MKIRLPMVLTGLTLLLVLLSLPAVARAGALC
jgi:hypothetical protein